MATGEGRARGPRRTCVGCRAIREQGRLVRLVADGSGGLAVNPRRASGRGAYLCPLPDCLEQALRRRALPRALRTELPRLDVARLRQWIEDERRRVNADDMGAGL